MASLPMEDSGESDSDHELSTTSEVQLKKYVVRLTPQEVYTFEDVIEWLEAEQFELWVIGEEDVPQQHFHLVIMSHDEHVDMRQIVSTFIRGKWALAERPIGRGWGNAQFNCQLAQEETPGMIDAAISYALKERARSLWFGYPDDYIQDCIDQSFSKKAPACFKKEYQELCDQFMKHDMEPRQFMAFFAVLKGKYGQALRMSDAYGYYMSNAVKKYGLEFAVNRAEEYLYKV